jgi:hypothetical protein
MADGFSSHWDGGSSTQQQLLQSETKWQAVSPSAAQLCFAKQRVYAFPHSHTHSIRFERKIVSFIA